MSPPDVSLNHPKSRGQRRKRPKPLDAVKPGCKFAACHGTRFAPEWGQAVRLEWGRGWAGSHTHTHAHTHMLTHTMQRRHTVRRAAAASPALAVEKVLFKW